MASLAVFAEISFQEMVQFTTGQDEGLEVPIADHMCGDQKENFIWEFGEGHG
jgi:hypothetical protein